MGQNMNKITLTAILILLFVTNKAMSVEFDVQKFLNKTYVTIGTGYKFDEERVYSTDSKGVRRLLDDHITARIEIGYQVSKHLTVGISHHSQWLSGSPFNDTNEYYKTEFFIDYTFSLGRL